MKLQTFSSFKDSNLYSKKDWYYSNNFVFYMGFITPFILILLTIDIFNILKKIKIITLIFIIFISYILADLITAIIHCYYIDNSFSEEKYQIENGYIIMNTKKGYASCHHIFPSNWKDISDYTIFISALSFFFFPILLLFLTKFNLNIKLLIYFIIILLIFALFTHKYSHEKLHGRYVPYCIDFLLDKKIFLSPKIHQKHHIENNYNWALLNSSSDIFFNSFIYNVCYYFKKCPVEESVNNTKIYINQNHNKIVNIKFIGDIEGVIKCKLYNNLFIKPI